MSLQEECLFEISKHDLGAAEFCSADDTRPMLQNVKVHINAEKQIEMVATDSYMLVKHKPRDFIGEPFTPFLIPASVLQQVNKLVWKATKYNPAPIIRVFRNKIVLDGYGAIPSITVEFKPEGDCEVDKYPDVDKLLNNIERNANRTVSLNAKYVAKVLKFLDAAEYAGSIDVTVNAALAPVEFQTKLTYAVVMPLKK